ncbi:glycoside hydrolase family 28 protein [Vibrio sp. AK197]
MKLLNKIALLLFTSSTVLVGCNLDLDTDSDLDTPESPSAPSSVMQMPYVPTLAYDDTSVSLVWNKPSDYSDIVDYRVYMNGESLGLASENNSQFNPAKPYMDAFAEQDSAGFHHRPTYLNYKVEGLTPATDYQFSVAAVYADGHESNPSPAVSVTTAQFTHVVDVTDFGAVGDGETYNTVAIQQAIDQCSGDSTSAYGCKVVIPANSNGAVFMTGALYLKSNMTFEIEQGATLAGSIRSADYPLSEGYQLYSYRTHDTDSRRPPSLLNVLSEDHRNTSNGTQDGYDGRRGVFENIRVVGKGVLDGNGWVVSGTTQDEVGNTLPYHEPGSREKVYTLGVLAMNQMLAGYQEYAPESWTGSMADIDFQGQVNRDLYADRRSSLTTFRGVTNMYVADLTFRNPAYHGVMFLEGENIVFAYTTTQTFDINNADGVEFGNTSNFHVYANFIDSGDDCINFAAGQGEEYDQANDEINPTEDGWVFNNYTREGHGVLVAGSHTGAWIQDILAEENVAFMTDNGLRLKSTPATGGGARDIVFRDNAMKDIGTNNTHDINGVEIDNRGGQGNAFIFTLSYSAGDNVYTNANEAAYFHDITVTNVTLDNVDPSGNAKAVIQSDAYDGSINTLPYSANYHQNIVFDHVSIRNSKVTNIHRLKDSTFSNVTFENWEEGYDSPWQIEDSQNLTFEQVSPMPDSVTQ